MKRSQRWLCERSDTWYHYHPQSEQCGFTTRSVYELVVWNNAILVKKLLGMYRNQRRLLRGCRGNKDYESSPLKDFPPDEVIGFAKGSGAAGGGGKVGVNGEPQKGSYDAALARARMLDEFLRETKFNDDESRGADGKQKLQHLNERMREAFDIKPFSEQLLFGTMFDTSGTEATNALIDRLQRHGAIHFGTTVTCGDGTMPSTSLPHPHHAAIQLGGSCGSGALAVSLGMSSFSLGTNGGGSNRISAGLLGLSAFHHGAGGSPFHSNGGGMGAIARTPIDNALIVNAALEKPVMMSELVDRFKEELPTGTRIGWLSTFAPEFAKGEDRHAFPGFDESVLPCMSLHPSIDAALQGAVGVLQTHYPRLQKNRLAMTPLNGSLKEFSHTFFLEWMKHAAKMSKMVAFEAWDEMWRRLWTAAKIPLVDWATDPQQMWDTMWTEMVKEVARERNLPEVATGTTRVKMPSHVAGTAEAMSMAMSEVIRTQTLRFARKRFISSDPHGVPRADFEAILAAADAWSGDKRMEDSNVYEKRQEEHRRAASELPVDYILTPLLRIPYWKTPGPDRKNPIYTARNTNPAVPFLPTCMGKDAKGDPLEILDPTFNPYCILANVWKTPSVTIALTTWVPHPTEDGRKCAVPHALLLTKLPKPEDKLNPTPVETPAELEATMELLFVAHKLLFLLNGYTGVGCEPAYIKELWETDGAPDNVRVTWPEEFDDPNV